MRVLSAFIFIMTLVMAAVAYTQPDSIPLYVPLTGVAMAVVTFLSARLASFLRMFVLAYVAVFLLFSFAFVAFAYGAVPELLESTRPKPFLMIAVTVFAWIVYGISRIPLISTMMALCEPYFRSRAPDAILPWGKTRWQMSEGQIGRFFLIAILALNLIQVYITILFNEWYGRLFNALQNKDATSFGQEIAIFLLLAVAWIISQVIEYVCGQYLLIRWRRWMSTAFFERWMQSATHYRMQFYGEKADNPDQRIAEDIRTYVVETYTISLSLFSKLLSLAAFVQVLWGLSATFKYQIGSVNLDSVPGYLVWVALAYAVIVTFVAHLIGRALIRLNFNKEKAEANFRFSLARTREYGEQIALLKGGPTETESLRQQYTGVVAATWALVDRQKNLVLFNFSVGQLSVVLPYVLLAPAYFSGATDLGGFQRTANAFSQVQDGFTVFVDLYTRLAAYRAALDRIVGFDATMARAHREIGEFKRDGSHAETLDLAHVKLTVPSGQVIATVNDMSFAPGERTLVTGPSGSGKSTMFRAIAGIWPYGEGSIHIPSGSSILLLPQRPYIPMGTLRAAVSYPGGLREFSDAELKDALDAAQLGHLAERLDDDDQWPQRLSGGEQQRLAIARALLAKPQWLFLDEATASLDEEMEALIYQVLRDKLPATTIISIGHRSTLHEFHTARVDMQRQADGAFAPQPRTLALAS